MGSSSSAARQQRNEPPRGWAGRGAGRACAEPVSCTGWGGGHGKGLGQTQACHVRVLGTGRSGSVLQALPRCWQQSWNGRMKVAVVTSFAHDAFAGICDVGSSCVSIRAPSPLPRRRLR